MGQQEERNSFNNLLNKCKVIIPIIQRDYAQGRLDAHAKIVRGNFLKAIRLSIQKNEPLDLNFVYGKTVKNRNKSNFYPVDGQQRLTTLFLVHWFLFKKYGKEINLKNFSYEARLTSKDFFKSFIDNSSKITLPTTNLNNDGEKRLLSEEIKNSVWFDETWQFDPTVKGVLKTLDDIEIEFKDITEEEASRLLDQDNCPITFILEYMDYLGEPDALYIKLNSRGRPLTYLELFKAKVFEIISKLNLEYGEDFKSNFDEEWTNLIWGFIKDEPKLFDRTFLNVFWIIYNNYLIENEKFSMHDDNELEENKRKDISNYNLWIEDFNQFGEYDDKSKQNMRDYLSICYNFLNSIKKFDDKYQKIIKEIVVKEDKKITYDDMATIFALTKYISKYQDMGKFGEFYRVFSNLLINSVGSDKIDSIPDLQKAFTSIELLVNNADDILGYLRYNNQVIKLGGFSNYQLQEEIDKAIAMENNEEFKKAILLAEEFPYFDGQIGSALYLSKSNEDDYDIDVFKKYWETIKTLFKDYEVKNNEIKKLNLIRRALLCFGDYRLTVGDKTTLCPDNKSESHKTPSLKTLFRSNTKELRALLNAINENQSIENQSVGNKLKNIIDNAKTKYKISNWQYLFIDEPKMFEESEELRMCENNGKIYILKKVNSTLNTNQDIYLKYLYVKLYDNYKNNKDLTFDSGANESELRFKKKYRLEHNDNEIVLTKDGDVIDNIEITDSIVTEVQEILDKKCLI